MVFCATSYLELRNIDTFNNGWEERSEYIILIAFQKVELQILFQEGFKRLHNNLQKFISPDNLGLLGWRVLGKGVKGFQFIGEEEPRLFGGEDAEEDGLITLVIEAVFNVFN